MNRAERRRAARNMTHATQSIMRARGGYEREYERGAKDAERHAIKMIFAGAVSCSTLQRACWLAADGADDHQLSAAQNDLPAAQESPSAGMEGVLRMD